MSNLKSSSIFTKPLNPIAWIEYLKEGSGDIHIYKEFKEFFPTGVIGYDKDNNFYLYGDTKVSSNPVIKFNGNECVNVPFEDFMDVKFDICGIFEKGEAGEIFIKCSPNDGKRLIDGLDNIAKNHSKFLLDCFE